jgi:hypothetical protein
MPMLSYHRGSEEWLWLHYLLATDNISPPNESLMLLLWTHWRYDDDDDDDDYDATADPLVECVSSLCMKLTMSV